MKKLPYGRTLPEVGDSSDDIFNALEGNIQNNDRHTHDGINSPLLLLNNFRVPTLVIAKSEWSTPSGGRTFVLKRIPQGIDIASTPLFVTESIRGCNIFSEKARYRGATNLFYKIDLRGSIYIESNEALDLIFWFIGQRQDDTGTFGASAVFARGWAPAKTLIGLNQGVNNANSLVGGSLGRRSGSTGTDSTVNAYYFFLWPKVWGFIQNFEFAGQLGTSRFERIGTVTYSGTEFWGLISTNPLQNDIDYTYIMEGNGDSGAMNVYRPSGIGV